MKTSFAVFLDELPLQTNNRLILLCSQPEWSFETMAPFRLATETFQDVPKRLVGELIVA
jgi:hypothetical protein